MSKQKLQKSDEAPRSGAPSNDNLPVQMAGRRSIDGLPWVWIALSGLATIAWLVAIGWVVFKVFRWLAE